MYVYFNPLNSELNPISHLVEFLEAGHILHVSRIRVKWAVFSQLGYRLNLKLFSV
jgi:hypothetical protein